MYSAEDFALKMYIKKFFGAVYLKIYYFCKKTRKYQILDFDILNTPDTLQIKKIVKGYNFSSNGPNDF